MGGCMTPEQTLDWLAQKHFDQCREDRPVQTPPRENI